MVNIVENVVSLTAFIQENLGKETLEVIVTENIIEKVPEIANKYGYALIDGEDLQLRASPFMVGMKAYISPRQCVV